MSSGSLEATQADEGNSIPVIFEIVDVSPNVVAFIAETPKTIKKQMSHLLGRIS